MTHTPWRDDRDAYDAAQTTPDGGDRADAWTEQHTTRPRPPHRPYVRPTTWADALADPWTNTLPGESRETWEKSA